MTIARDILFAVLLSAVIMLIFKGQTAPTNINTINGAQLQWRMPDAGVRR